MVPRFTAHFKSRFTRRTQTHALPKATRRALAVQKRARGGDTEQTNGFLPPEDWHEPSSERGQRFRVIVQDPGPDMKHVLTEAQIRARLEQLPPHLVAPLQVVQLSRMTRKKQSFPCYGMQWGTTIYLYPLENELIEYYNRPPRPAEFHEARLYGGNWVQTGSVWRLEWTRESVEDFYLNNVLMHELGHLLDHRNNRHVDRERYAEWFAIHYGYKPTQAERRRRLCGVNKPSRPSAGTR
jgi:hypothetical protein